MTIMSMTQGSKLLSGWTCPNSWPSTKPFQMNGHANYYKKKMKWEESAMLSISTSNTPNRSKTVTKAILQHNQHSLKRRKLEIISTSLSQFIWFPRFHHFICICSFVLFIFQSIHSMMLQTLWRIQSTYSEHEVKFVTSSPFHLQTSSTVTTNLDKAIVNQFDSNNHLHSFTTIPPYLACYLIYLIHSTKKTLILTSHVKWTHLSILITNSYC